MAGIPCGKTVGFPTDSPDARRKSDGEYDKPEITERDFGIQQ